MKPNIFTNCFTNKSLSLQAKGLFAYIMTIYMASEIRKDELVKQFSNGRDSIYKAFKELLDNNYIIVKDELKTNGQFGKRHYFVNSKRGEEN